MTTFERKYLPEVFLHKISLSNYRNYADSDFSFKKKITCITGKNGSGKTNLLDAIYYLCITKSYFASTDYQNIRHGESWMALRGEMEVNGSRHQIKCKLENQKRKEFFLDDNRYDKLTEHIGFLPVVFITPNDVELIYGSSEERRRFLDLMLSQTNHEYLNKLQEYNRLLLQRNAALKQFAESGNFNASLLDAYDNKMAEPSAYIYKERQKAVTEILPYISETCFLLSGKKESMSVEHESDLQRDSMENLLAKNRERDRLLRRTSNGVHRDDLAFTMDNFELRKYGSQGQQKSFLIAFKLAWYQWLKKKKEALPFLLLDDIFDKLDPARCARLLELIQGNEFGQIFITDTQRGRLEGVFTRDEDVAFIEMEKI